ncbi:THI6 [Candida pseudojiufengensis]|uniref:THI6 n=1 Tax=Candida pseudojiufengensis TaxID=497109 RepID=UPI00222424B9|nr:THI6 [Candida pseudojiufengensis]KAI5966458.1 THI6 [Candida pseudojiufengensis]
MVDYSVYLVTDSSMIPESSTFLNQVKGAIENGVTIVQLREKTLSTRDFIKRAKEVHELTKRKGIPLIINDRIDVALAIDAEGVHVGQDDMPASIVRKLIGSNKILGVTCSTCDEVKEVVEQGLADYVGLGTVFATNTKKDVTNPEGVGPIGIRKMLYELKKSKKRIQSVAIGGINQSNAARVNTLCSIKDKCIDGVAVVSCIMASENAGKSTAELCKQLRTEPLWSQTVVRFQEDISMESIRRLVRQQPLVHHITNNVVKNFSANVTLAIGASPVMSELPQEFKEFVTNIPVISLVVNLGTPNEELMKVFKTAIQVYSDAGKPIVFDPVACGASKARFEACRKLLNHGHVSVIKGNVGEIMSIWKLTSSCIDKEEKSYMRGVDSIAKIDDNIDELEKRYMRELDSIVIDDNINERKKSYMRGVDSIAKIEEDKLLRYGREIANDFLSVVVITGPKNYIISRDGRHDIVPGGSPLMGSITGTGCSLGSTIASFIAVEAAESGKGTGDIYQATLHAVQLYNEAGKYASESTTTPGSFMINFLDELYRTTHG